MEGGFYCATFALEEDHLKVLTGGPWMIYGAYLTVQPWSLEFDAKTGIVSKVVAWIRIPGLSIRYYHKSTLRVIGTLLGEEVKIDYMTEMRGRGKYTRVAVIIDLLKPLIPSIKVDGTPYFIEYEGLPHIFFACGKHGHSKERCGDKEQQSEKQKPSGQGSQSTPPSSTTLGPLPREDLAAGDASLEKGSPYGSWMLVKYPKKGNKQYKGKQANSGGLNIMGGSRYNVLYDCEDSPPSSMPADKPDDVGIAEPNDQTKIVPATNQGKKGNF
ncbi:hypothetical protein K1719_019947 [Acacia pycnantha]|nr:hypothetical protein K1719_019947 [Acacia pycnantha]